MKGMVRFTVFQYINTNLFLILFFKYNKIEVNVTTYFTIF